MTTSEENVELESQFILRLPPAQAEVLREAVKSGVMNLKDRLTIQLDNDVRHGNVRFDDWSMPCRVYDLPSIIESYKTLDRKNLYKTADISQIMICKEDESHFATVTGNKANKDVSKEKKFLYPHGITPPLKNVRSRRFRKTLKKKCVDFAEVEKEVKRLFKTDSEAVSVRYEVVGVEDSRATESHPQSPSEVEGPSSGMNSGNLVHDLFGEEVSSSDDDIDAFNVSRLLAGGESDDGNSRLSAGQLSKEDQLTTRDNDGDEDDDDVDVDELTTDNVDDDDSRTYEGVSGTHTFDRTSDAQYSGTSGTSGPTTFENLLANQQQQQNINANVQGSQNQMEIDIAPDDTTAGTTIGDSVERDTSMEEEDASAQLAQDDARQEKIQELEREIQILQEQRRAQEEEVAGIGNDFLRSRFQSVIANLRQQEEAKRKQIEELSRF